ncbi:MAG: hypothetical protein LBR23_07240 [Spirochaetaceae bacterium]|jgi:hypothetical protein|nr:hypothetical protein [Spirochaetaceae bacterium]
MVKTQLLHEIDTLTPEKIAEVFDFIVCLKGEEAPVTQAVQSHAANWRQELFRHMELAHGHSNGKKWTREELHRG